MKTGIKNSIIAMGILGLFMGTTAVSFAGYFNNAPVYNCGTVITRTLQTGSENDDVYALQMFLSRGGYLYANPNGYFGPATKSAVKRFQSDNGIYQSGIVGESTLNAINERICDADVRGDSLSYSNYGYYGYQGGVTYVDAYDPYARVVTPPITSPVVYTNPQSNIFTTSYETAGINYAQPNFVTTPVANIPVPTIPQVQSTNIIYSPSIGYTYGIVPQSGSLTISSPGVNSHYNEGDTVNLAWSTINMNVGQYQVFLENTNTGQSKFIMITSGNTATFVLTKELLDAVCAGACDNNQQGSFRIVIATPITDIVGTTSMFRAMVSPITIKRPLGFFGTVSISGSKNPVNTGEGFKLYVNIPGNVSRNNEFYGQYSFRIRAICPPSTTVSVAGVPCGQDFSIPFTPTYFQQEIPAIITNSTYYRQDVIFEIVVSNTIGQIISTARTTVTVNPAPFNW